MGGAIPPSLSSGGKMSDESKMKDVTDKIDEDMLKKEAESVSDVTGSNFKKVRASHSGKMYTFKPASLADMPMVSKKINEVQKFMVAANDDSASDEEMFMKEDGKLLNLMAEIIVMGIGYDDQGNEMTIERVKKEFTIGDFPNCLGAALDVNDFLLGMRNLYQKRMKLT